MHLIKNFIINYWLYRNNNFNYTKKSTRMYLLLFIAKLCTFCVGLVAEVLLNIEIYDLLWKYIDTFSFANCCEITK